jgi:cyclohexanone monooxygenase
MAIKLKREGIEDFVVLERDQQVGGTWWANTYPGCGCDVPSHLYSFSFAPNPDWTRTYSKQPEIEAYLQRVAEDFGVTRHVRLGTTVTGARWDDDARRWTVETDQGDVSARVLISAAGALSEPSTPDIEGIYAFHGHTFHSARWDHDHDLEGKRVAVIGTGASAIQFVPTIAPDVAQMHVFQRTAPWIMPHSDRPISARERRLYKRFPILQKLVRGGIYSSRELLVLGFVKHPRLMKVAEKIARKHMRKQISDPELLAKVTPDYTIGCKRILISNDYFPAIAAPNAELVTGGIAEVRPHSILDREGVERPTDTIVPATGPHVPDLPIARKITGREGRTLADVWADGMVSNRSSTVAGFPNLFLLVGPNVGVGHTSMVYMIESQVAYVDNALQAMDAEGLDVLETTEAAQQAYRDLIAEKSKGTVWLAGGCASWYLDKHGHNTTLWPDFTCRFRKLTRTLDRENYVGTPAVAPTRSPEVAA